MMLDVIVLYEAMLVYGQLSRKENILYNLQNKIYFIRKMYFAFVCEMSVNRSVFIVSKNG